MYLETKIKNKERKGSPSKSHESLSLLSFIESLECNSNKSGYNTMTLIM